MKRILYIAFHRFPAAAPIEDALWQALSSRHDVTCFLYSFNDLSQQFQPNALTMPVPYQLIAGAIPTLCVELQIDWVFLPGDYYIQQVNPACYTALKKLGVKIVGWFFDDPYHTHECIKVAPWLDAVFTVEAAAVPVDKTVNPALTCHFLPLGYHPGIHQFVPSSAPAFQSDICFIGTPFEGSSRVRTLDAIAPILGRYHTRLIGETQRHPWSKTLRHFKQLQHCVQPHWISHTAAFSHYANAKINLILHRDFPVGATDREQVPEGLTADSPCERIFNIAALGGFQIVDNSRPVLFEFFKRDQKIVVFDSPEELGDKITYYLHHDKERDAIRNRAYRRVQQLDYTLQLSKLLQHTKII